MIPQVKVDPFRIIVNGLSGGGGATWMFVEAYPKMTAAAIPMSGVTSQDVPHMASLIYNPIWLLTGGLDDSPSPFTAGQVATEAANQGCDFFGICILPLPTIPGTPPGKSQIIFHS